MHPLYLLPPCKKLLFRLTNFLGLVGLTRMDWNSGSLDRFANVMIWAFTQLAQLKLHHSSNVIRCCKSMLLLSFAAPLLIPVSETSQVLSNQILCRPARAHYFWPIHIQLSWGEQRIQRSRITGSSSVAEDSMHHRRSARTNKGKFCAFCMRPKT